MKRIFFGLCLVGLLYYGLSTWQGQSGKTAVVSAATISNVYKSLVHQARQHSGASSTGVEGQPTISGAFIDKVLAAAGSKATGTGEALYDDGVQYGIDPVYALAFFMHESTFGTAGVARATLSLGNIRCTPGYQCIEGYRAYGSYQDGYLDWYKLIKNGYITGQVSSQCPCITIEQIIPVYAPASDHNNVAGYISAVENAVKVWRTGKITIAGVN